MLTQLKFESPPNDGNIEHVSFSRIAEAFAIKMKASASKMVTPNPRVEILQQGFNETTGIVTTQTSEPLLLDTWNTPYPDPYGGTVVNSDEYLNEITDYSGLFWDMDTVAQAAPFSADSGESITNATVAVKATDTICTVQEQRARVRNEASMCR
eukprot:COSAG02_NODE_892_length_16138_cov_14.599875_11_plen_154_part_00